MYKNDEVYGKSIEFYDIAALSQISNKENVLKKFIEMAVKHQGIILDIGAGTGKVTVKVAKLASNKEVIALEPSSYMRTAFMTRMMEHKELERQITIFPLGVSEYTFDEKVSGILCMGVLGHLSVQERQELWKKLENTLEAGVPVLIELLDQRFLSASEESRISVAIQGRLRYETYITSIKQLNQTQWEWILTYRIFDGKRLVKQIKSPMSWTYESVEEVLGELTKVHFRGVKLSDTLLLATKTK